MQNGFSLIELLAVMTITGILALAGVSEFAALNREAQSSLSAQMLVSDIRRARAEAPRYGGRAVINLAGGPTAYALGVDFAPYSAEAAPDTILIQRDLPDGIQLSLDQAIIFNSQGFLINEEGATTETAGVLTRGGVAIRSFLVDSIGGIS